MPITIDKSSDGYYSAIKKDGELITSSNTSFETVFQAALDLGGDINLNDNDYLFSTGGSFAGVKIKSNTRLRGSKKARLFVPNGYAGSTIIFDSSYNTVDGGAARIEMDGIQILESGATPAQNWVGIHYKSNTANKGITQNNLQNLYIKNAGVSLLLEVTDPAAWINSNMYTNLVLDAPRVGVEHRKTAPAGLINNEKYYMTIIQSQSLLEYGFKSIDGTGHEFYSSGCIDIYLSAQPSPKTAQFLSTADQILIFGGVMTYQWDNQTTKKGAIKVIDSYAGYPNPILDFNEGIYQTNATGIGSTFNIPHSLGQTPTKYFVRAISKDAGIGSFYYTVNSTNIAVTYFTHVPTPATPGNQNNMKWYWRAAI